MRKYDSGKQLLVLEQQSLCMIFVLQGKPLSKQVLGNEGSVEAALPTSNISLPITLQ